MTVLIPEKTGLTVKAKLFRGFGERSRLGILDALRQGPLKLPQPMSFFAIDDSPAQYNYSVQGTSVSEDGKRHGQLRFGC